MRSIVLVIPYFGRWPEWFPVFLASCQANPSVEWHFHTDCPLPSLRPPNVKFYATTLEAYARRVARTLDIQFAPRDPYKIIDMRATIGVVHADEIAGFDNFGFGDIDVIYGNLRKFYTDDVLSHDVVSTHNGMISGHLCVLRNVASVRQAFRRIPGWQALLSDPQPTRFDEDYLWYAYVSPGFALNGLLFSLLARLRRPDDGFEMNSLADRCRWLKSLRWANHLPRQLPMLTATRIWGSSFHFKEQYSTVLTPYPWHDGSPTHPDTWYWQEGRLTNARDGEREFPYLHFMNFVSARFARPGERADWRGLPRVVNFAPEAIDGRVVRIDRGGFHLASGAARQA